MSLLSSCAVVTSDVHGTILSANSAASKMFGYSQEEFIGAKVNMLMPSPYAEQHDSYLEKYQKTKKPQVLGTSRVVPALNKRGENFDVILSVSESETSRGDIYIGLFEYAPDKRVIIDTDSKGKIYGVKGNVFLSFGYHRDELIGKNIKVIIPDEIAHNHDKYMKDYNDNPKLHTKLIGKIRNLNAKHKNQDLVNISLLVKKAILKIRDNGTITEINGFRGILTPTANMEAMVSISMKGKILDASDNFSTLFGYKHNEIIGHSIKRLMNSDPKDFFSSRMKGSSTGTIEAVHKDKSIFIAQISVHKARPTDSADSKLQENVFVCKIGRASIKKDDKESISEGENVGVYKYGKILGSGFFGKVRMATHRITGENVAIKTLRKKQYEKVNMEYPPREISILKSLCHPYINQLYDTVVVDDRIHLILEYIEGRELCEIVETEQIPEEVCRHLFRQIILAIEYMHDNGIVHRDLKLENIIINRNGNAKIIDLGFGNFVLNKNHLLRTFCGSPDYAAPELFLGKAYDGFKADCWSIGVLLYAMLSGLLPFKNSQCTMNVAFDYPNSISHSARDLISNILQKDIDKRFTIEQMKEHPWTNIGYEKQPEQPPNLFTCLDKGVIDSLETYGMDPITVRKSLQKQEFNQFTTTYFLQLNKKKQREYNKQIEQEKNTTKSKKSDKPNKNDKPNKKKNTSGNAGTCLIS